MTRNGPRKKKWPRKRLAELISFIEDQHGGNATTAAIAEKIGTSAKNVTTIFQKDDMFLSRAEHIAECYGHTLRILYPKKEIFFSSDTHVRMKDFPNAGNLAGLVQYLKDMKITVTNLTKRVDVPYVTLDGYFTRGDIPLSVLERITDNLHIEPRWEFTKKTRRKAQPTSQEIHQNEQVS